MKLSESSQPPSSRTRVPVAVVVGENRALVLTHCLPLLPLLSLQ
jgi:hypothetical protein